MKKSLIAILVLVFFMTVTAQASELYVATTDYYTGRLAVFDSNSRTINSSSFTINGGDVVSRSFNRKVYIVDRGNAAISVFDKDDLSSPVAQFSVGAGTNPHDILVLNPYKAYVTLYGSDKLLIVNPTDGSQLGTIDLSDFADEDEKPEMDLMVYAGGKVFITLQRLYNFSPTSLSQVVVIDPSTNTVLDADPATSGVQAIDLTLTNPNDMKYVKEAGKILISEAASPYITDDGGLEFIDPDTYAAEGILVTEEALGGNLGGGFGAFDMINGTEGYAIVADADWTTKVVRFNLSAGTASVVINGTGYDFSDVLVVDDELILADRNYTDPGIRVFDAEDDKEITASPISTGLPPFCLTEIQKPDDPVDLIFGENSVVSILFHFMLENVMSQTEEGRSLVDFYYAIAPYITAFLQI